MGYIINFVGLINFFGDTSDEKLLLLPDGTNPPDNRIPPHFANIFVIDPHVVDASQWPAESDPITRQIKVSRFAISEPSKITISGQSANAGQLNISQQDALVPRLKVIDEHIDIQPEQAATIAQIPINNGTLSPYLLGKASVIARLEVKQKGLLTITATTSSGASKTLFLRNGSEIVISNTSQIGAPKRTDEVSHFQLYGQLDVNRGQNLTLNEPDPSTDLDQLPSGHPYIAFLRDSEGHIPLPGCSVTNCCSCCDK